MTPTVIDGPPVTRARPQRAPPDRKMTRSVTPAAPDASAIPAIDPGPKRVMYRSRAPAPGERGERDRGERAAAGKTVEQAHSERPLHERLHHGGVRPYDPKLWSNVRVLDGAAAPSATTIARASATASSTTNSSRRAAAAAAASTPRRPWSPPQRGRERPGANSHSLARAARMRAAAQQGYALTAHHEQRTRREPMNLVEDVRRRRVAERAVLGDELLVRWVGHPRRDVADPGDRELARRQIDPRDRRRGAVGRPRRAIGAIEDRREWIIGASAKRRQDRRYARPADDPEALPYQDPSDRNHR